MAKGYINKETRVLADNVNEPHILDEGGVTDVVSDHITDIIADNAHEIFDTDETKEAIDGTAVLIETIITDGETLSYNITNLDYRQIILKFKSVVNETSNIGANIKYNNNFIANNTVFSGVNNVSLVGIIKLADVYIPFHVPVGAYTSYFTVWPTHSLSLRMRFINNVNISFNSLPANLQEIEIWGVK